MDDALIRGCLAGELDLETIRQKLRKVEDGVFTGRPLKLVQYRKEQAVIKVRLRRVFVIL